MATSVFKALGSYADRIRDQHSSNSSSSSSPTPALSSVGSSKTPPPPAPMEDDGSWETVQTGRKARPGREKEKETGSSSRNWRDRPAKERSTDKDEGDKRTKSKRSASAAPSEKPARAAAPSSNPTKSAWTTPVASSRPAASTPGSTTSTVIQTPATNGTNQSHTEPSSPSLNGTTLATSAPSLASPNLSAETASSSTAPTSLAVKGEEPESNWQQAVAEPVEVPKSVAPAPTVNPWEVRRKKMAPTADVSPKPVLQFGSVSPTIEEAKEMSNGHEPVKIGKKKKPDVPVIDEMQWPDVAKAAVVSKEEKKDVKPVEEVEEASTKKPKWKPIPAAELLAAVDEAAEANRRQAKKKAAKPVETSKSVKPKRDESRRGETRFPPMPNGQKAAGFKPIFGTVQPGSDDGVERLEPIVNGASSAPLSRQSSRVSRRGSPVKSVTQLPSPSQPAVDTMRFGTGPFRSQPMMGNASAPLPQQPFNPNANNFPRPPRRDGRNSFSAVRGRGGFRGGRGFHDVAQENLYQRGYGMGYQQQPYGFPGMYDPAQAQFANMQMFGRGAMPPPPLPQTPAQNLDPLRFYVLGQVEYYFSMQNLAMDFFLRQQMDSEGWIEIPMIASFNRIKSLTPEVAIVKEVMLQSSLLEVKEDHVRLSNGESKRWVLPDAKPSIFPADLSQSSPSQSNSEVSADTSATTAMGVSDSLATSFDEMGLTMDLGVQPKYNPGDVENALMKSVTLPPSSSASMLNGESGSVSSGLEKNEEESTPGTSVAGDAKGEDADVTPTGKPEQVSVPVEEKR